MSDRIIRVENVSKKFIISHEDHATYNSLRDLIVGNVKKMFSSKSNDNRISKEEFWALKDLNFEIKRGDCVGIIGHNGAGKSTLLKILSRITEPTNGQIDIEGRVASLLEVGTGFHPELTGRENIFLNGAILGMSRAEIRKKFDEIVAFAEVEKFLDTPVKRYSSGMYVRLAFAVAAHLEPEILIVDEVLAVGDVQFQKKCLGKMEDVSKKEGRTVLFVSHNMGAVRDLCSSAIILSKGKLDYEGDTSDVITYYLEKNKKFIPETNIRFRNDRQGTGQVIITEIRCLDPKTQREIDSVICGECLIIEVTYESQYYLKETIDELVVGLTIFNKDEVFVTPLNSNMAGDLFKNVPRNGVLNCIINKVPLMSGKFIVDAGLVVDKVQSDLVRNAINLFVHEGDYYGFGVNNSGGRQGVFIEQEWSMRDE